MAANVSVAYDGYLICIWPNLWRRTMTNQYRWVPLRDWYDLPCDRPNQAYNKLKSSSLSLDYLRPLLSLNQLGFVPNRSLSLLLVPSSVSFYNQIQCHGSKCKRNDNIPCHPDERFSDGLLNKLDSQQHGLLHLFVVLDLISPDHAMGITNFIMIEGIVSAFLLALVDPLC